MEPPPRTDRRRRWPQSAATSPLSPPATAARDGHDGGASLPPFWLPGPAVLDAKPAAGSPGRPPTGMRRRHTVGVDADDGYASAVAAPAFVSEGNRAQAWSPPLGGRPQGLDRLPWELVLEIFAFLDLSSIAVAAQVCRRWHAIAADNWLWQQLYRRHGLRVPTQLPTTRAVSWNYLFREQMRLRKNWQTAAHTFRSIHTSQVTDGTMSVYCLQFDAHKIVVGLRDTTMAVYERQSLTRLATFRGHSASVLCLQYDDTKIISGSTDTTIKVWNLQTTECTATLHGHSQPVLCLCFNETTLVTGSKDYMVLVWNVATMTVLHRLGGHIAAVNAISLKSNLIVSASGDRTLRVWNPQTGTCMGVLAGHDRGIACVHFDGTYIVSGSSDRQLRVWDVRTGALLRRLEGHENLVRAVTFSVARDLIVSGSYDGRVGVWRFSTGQLLYWLERPLPADGTEPSYVYRVQFNDCAILAGCQDGRLLLWDFTEGIDPLLHC